MQLIFFILYYKMVTRKFETKVAVNGFFKELIFNLSISTNLCCCCLLLLFTQNS